MVTYLHLATHTDLPKVSIPNVKRWEIELRYEYLLKIVRITLKFQHRCGYKVQFSWKMVPLLEGGTRTWCLLKNVKALNPHCVINYAFDYGVWELYILFKSLSTMVSSVWFDPALNHSSRCENVVWPPESQLAFTLPTSWEPSLTVET